MDAMNLKVKLYLENGNDKFMGIGVLWLLQKVRECRSLREAAQEMGISYSKAFRMVKNLEEALGADVLDRRRGGSERNGASLTPFGERFIVLYDEFQMECKELMKGPFSEFSAKLDELLFMNQ